MRRFIPLLAALLVLGVAPGVTAAATSKCSIEVTPASGGSTDIYRVTASNFPVDPNGGGIEVRIDVRRLGTRTGSIYFLFLIPGITEFYLDLNQPAPGEPIEPVEPGRYLVLAQTAHLAGCHAIDHFVVE
jgi:hypothetical protein